MKLKNLNILKENGFNVPEFTISSGCVTWEKSAVRSSAEIEDNNAVGRLVLKQGDGISVTVRNSSATFSQALKSVYYSTKRNDIHIIVASASGTVAINGTT